MGNVPNGQNGTKWSKWPARLKIVLNVLNWLHMVLKDPKWYQMVSNGPSWPEMTNCVKWCLKVPIGLKCCKTRDGRRLRS